MNDNVKCIVYKFLFGVLPVKAWQAFLIDKHFAVCPLCTAEAAEAEGVDVLALPVSLEDSRRLPPLWEGVRRELENVDSPETVEPVRLSREKKKRPAFFPRWQWAAAGAGLLLMVLILPFSLLKNGTPEPGPGLTGAEEEQVVVQSVRIGSKAAKYYLFRSDNPDKLIVWAQKKEDVKRNES